MLVAATVGCGGSDSSAEGRTIQALWDRPGENVAVVWGTSDYSPGRIRASFLILRRDAKSIERPKARVWLATGREEVPFLETTARLLPVGAQEADEHAHAGAPDVRNLYVTHVRVPRPGTYWLLAEPVGGERIQAIGTLVVKRQTDSPPLGSRAYPSRTPTLASARGDVSKLTTRKPPDLPLLRQSIAGALAAERPFVVVFATPKFCESRTCGPVVDVVLRVSRKFRRRGIDFIHVEIYRDNDPDRGFNRWAAKEWHLPTEPWTFLVGRDGRIKAKFEGSFSAAELTAAITQTLV